MSAQYLPIAQYKSLSTPNKQYTVCIRTTGKPVLTCNCPGWTRRCPDGTDASRTCRHVEAERQALTKYLRKGQTERTFVPMSVKVTATMPKPTDSVELR